MRRGPAAPSYGAAINRAATRLTDGSQANNDQRSHAACVTRLNRSCVCTVKTSPKANRGAAMTGSAIGFPAAARRVGFPQRKKTTSWA